MKSIRKKMNLNAMYKGLAILVFAALLVAGTNVQAGSCAQYHNQIGLVGLDSSSGVIYAGVSGPKSCGCSQVRFSPSNTDTKAALSILMAAKLAGKTVRIDLLDRYNCNSAYRVYLQ